MHVKAKKTAFLGLLAAFSVLLIILGSVFESSTLFFLCAAAFCVGIANREWGVKYGGAFLAASSLTAFFVSPVKMYCFTYTAMGLYLWISEILWDRISKSQIKNKTAVLWAGRYIIFNVIYLPVIGLFPSLFIAKEAGGKIIVIFALAGQAGLFIFEKAHEYFQLFIWNKLRRYVFK